ncbi:MAG TPA: GNAT family N-acetyltransferase [Clostridia bacterium]|nr:GNAT family N-acetyltransferase [Clostridia bacterium]
MKFELRKLKISDGTDIYEMLQEIPNDEDGLVNNVNGKTIDEFREWLQNNDLLSVRKDSIGWKVPTTTFWLYVDDRPVGFGKLRHFLSDELRERGGNIGYSIRPSERKKGYGTVLLKLIIEEAKKMNIEKVLLTIRNNNAASIKVALNNNGKIEKS